MDIDFKEMLKMIGVVFLALVSFYGAIILIVFFLNMVLAPIKSQTEKGDCYVYSYFEKGEFQ